MTWFHAARARLRLLARRAAESRIDDEIRFHIEMETQKLVRELQIDPDEAKRRALATFGGVQQHRETLRDGRGTAWFSGLSLDLKLGLRMLAKYPGLTVVGGLAMAFGIWFGAVTFEMFGVITSTKLPLPDGDRIVRVVTEDLKAKKPESRMLYDYKLWHSLRSITDLGAYRNTSVNVVGADSSAQPVTAAEITASAFRIAPALPLHGRVLDESDERAPAPPVVVLGHEVWTKRFDSDPRIVGRNVQVGGSFATVVGVMPEGYAFPVSHEMWLPLRTDRSVEPRGGFPITVFGRLAPGMTFETAQAELTLVGKQLAAEHPTTHAQLQSHVVPYTKEDADDGDMGQVLALTYFFVVVLMVVVCSTVALLLFARAAARETELVVRSALGASRQRIIAQLFAEALVLAAVAAVAGLAAAQLALQRLGKPYMVANYDQLPFWFEFKLSSTTILSALGLAVIGALVAGVMPARKITRGLGTRLRAGTAGGGGVSFGGVWTAVIVIQVALTVALPSVVMLVHAERNRIASNDAGFPTKEYLGVTLGIDGPPDETLTEEMRTALSARFTSSLETLRQRLQAEPGVAGVTYVDRMPGDYHQARQAEVVSQPGIAPIWVATAAIDPSYFDVLKSPVLSGRAFTSADLSSDARVAIVDQGFVDRLMPGRNAIGHHVRLTSGEKADSTAAHQPWYEIVGVVKNLGMSNPIQTERLAGVYLPATPGSKGALGLVVHGRGDPLGLAPRVRQLATVVDPALRVDQVTRLDQIAASQVWFMGLWVKIIVGLTAVALLLSLAGIYSVLSYTVARRTREIGVRVALGANARRVIASIFRRPLTQVTLGVVAGSMFVAVAAVGVQQSEHFAIQTPPMLLQIILLIGYAVLMLGVCMLACVVPTVRALRVQPTEALRAE